MSRPSTGQQFAKGMKNKSTINSSITAEDPLDIAKNSLPVAISQVENIIKEVHTNLRNTRISKTVIPDTSAYVIDIAHATSWLNETKPDACADNEIIK